MTLKEMRALLALSQKEFCEKYGIPRRTLESWEAGERKPPEYMMGLLERAVIADYEALPEGEKAANAIVGRDKVAAESPWELSEEDIINNRFL